VRRVQIRKVARLGTGHTPSRSVEAYWDPAECTIPWLTLADVWQLRDGSVSVVNETKELISPLGLANSAAVRHPAGTVAFSRTASVGFSCILGVDMATSQDFVTWTCGPKLDPRYLLWVLRGERDDILRRTQGSTHKTIYMPDLEQLTVPLASIKEQRRVVEFLDAETARIDEVIRKRVATLHLLAERARSLLEEAVAESEAPNVKLRRFTRSIEQGVSSQAGSRPAGDHEWGVLKLSAVKWGSFLPDENKVLPSNFPIDEALRPAIGDLLVTRSNTPATVGDVCAVLEPPPPVLLPDLIYRLRFDERFDTEFASVVLRTSAARGQLSGIARGTSQSMVKLRGEDILDVRVPALGVDAQRVLVKRVNNLLAQQADLVRRVERQIEALREHRSSLISSSVATAGSAAA
jgi:type I restriction enzyme, S subunit